MGGGALEIAFIWQEEDGEEGCFSYKPGFDVGGKTVDRKDGRQKGRLAESRGERSRGERSRGGWRGRYCEGRGCSRV
jgi:hypothetical protein